MHPILTAAAFASLTIIPPAMGADWHWDWQAEFARAFSPWRALGDEEIRFPTRPAPPPPAAPAAPSTTAPLTSSPAPRSAPPQTANTVSIGALETAFTGNTLTLQAVPADFEPLGVPRPSPMALQMSQGDSAQLVSGTDSASWWFSFPWVGYIVIDHGYYLPVLNPIGSCPVRNPWNLPAPASPCQPVDYFAGDGIPIILTSPGFFVRAIP